MPLLSRRGFLAASAGLAALPLTPALASSPRRLTATRRTIEVAGKPATVFGLLDETGRPGLVLAPGERFAVELTNGLDIPTLIHWHGQIPPNQQDGVPDMPAPMLAPGESRSYDFAPHPGTHWMHAHIPEQEVGLLAAPLIVRPAEDTAQEVVILLHEFSFNPPEEVLAAITSGAAMAGMGHGMGSMDMGGMKMGQTGHDMSQMGGMAMDLNDYDFDAYLANDRTLDDPEVVSIDKGGEVRLRIINGAAATGFWIDTGAVAARAIAVDGEPVEPVPGRRFPLSMGQRLDLALTVPAEGGAFPILALREGAPERTGIVLATPGAKIGRLDGKGDPAPALDLGFESALRAMTPLAPRKVSPRMVMLSGQMAPYRWAIDGATWGSHVPIEVRQGERVELMFHNMSMMAHPMHLHGHKFQVVDLGQGRFSGALRDTVLVPPMAQVTVALDAGEAASWMLHCHHMAHLATGMMTEFLVA